MSHVLHLGDCLDPVSGFPSLADKSVGVTLTDPPFDLHVHSHRGARIRRTDGYESPEQVPFAALVDVAPVAAQIARVTQRWALVFCAVRQIDQWAVSFEAAGWSVPRVMAWIKPDASPQFSGDRPGSGYEAIVAAHAPGKLRWNGGGRKGVYVEARIDRDSGFLHPTQKPLGLIESLVSDFTDTGETVADPFSGSCTTGAACKRLGRRFIGWEIDPGFYEVGRKRLDAAREQFQLPRLPKAKQTGMVLHAPGAEAVDAQAKAQEG